MIDPFMTAMPYNTERIQPVGPPVSSGGDLTWEDASGGPRPFGNPDRIRPVGPPVPAPGEGDNRFQGRLRHGRGLPPGQQRKMGGLAQRWQQAGGAFEPGWRKQARQMQGGMQSMNGGGYQAAAAYSPQERAQLARQHDLQWASGTPQGGDIYSQQERNQLAGQYGLDWATSNGIPVAPQAGTLSGLSALLSGQAQPYRSPGFQAPPPSTSQPFGAGATTWENSMSNPAAHEAIRNWYANQGGMTSWVPDQGMNQVAPQRQMVDRSAYFDPFAGPF